MFMTVIIEKCPVGQTVRNGPQERTNILVRWLKFPALFELWSVTPRAPITISPGDLLILLYAM